MTRTIVAGAAIIFLGGCSSMEKEGAPNPTAPDGKFPPEAVDHMLLAVDLEIEIFGIGKDAFRLEGGVAVHRSGGLGLEGKLMKGDLIAASLRGDSKAFGRVVAIESPIQLSPAEYEWKGPGKYQGHFDVNGWFFLPRHDLVVFTKKPVRVEGPAEAIPPVGQVAEGVGLPCELYDFRKPGAPPIGSVSKARGKMLSKITIQDDLKAKEETIEEIKKSQG